MQITKLPPGPETIHFDRWQHDPSMHGKAPELRTFSGLEWLQQIRAAEHTIKGELGKKLDAPTRKELRQLLEY